ncbi:hypothetical protein SCREM1_17 [Synechococcus phage S-CREM1]|nr:hypothetical protein SCREM1_17 [Synechococcus phage S-CREM1]
MTFSQGLANEGDDPGFEIIHLSFRKRLSESLYGGPVNYYIGNIVFRLTEEHAINRMKYYMEENEELRVAPDLELMEKYYDNLHFVFDDEEEHEVDGEVEKYRPLHIRNKHGIKDEDVFIRAHRRNMAPLHDFIQYHEKFDCYQMREYFQDTPVVRGIIQYLQDMKDGKENPSRTVYSEQFINTLENLCWWWD